jgi:uncharacterized FlaG/YvyC family protein
MDMSADTDAVPMDSLVQHSALTNRTVSWHAEEEACELPKEASTLPRLLKPGKKQATKKPELPPSNLEVQKTVSFSEDEKKVEKTASVVEAERQRLKKLLYDFVKTALKGTACVCIQEVGERMTASYSLDKDLTKLVVRAKRDHGGELVRECPISQIKDVYSIAHDGESPFAAPVLAAIHPEERDRVLMLVCDLSPKDPNQLQICLVLDTVESRDTFLECLRMICLCARASSPSLDVETSRR